MINYNIPITVFRKTAVGEQQIAMKAIIGDGKIHLPVDADIEEGDRVERVLPNKKVTVMYVTNVEVLQSPFGTGHLDHTEAQYVTTPPRPDVPQGATFNVHATNVQVATGDYSQQTMTVTQTVDELALVIKGLSELLKAAGLVHGHEAELHNLQQAAIDDLTEKVPNGSAARRFYDWILSCAQAGGSTAVTAAITAAANGLLHDVEALIRTLRGG